MGWVGRRQVAIPPQGWKGTHSWTEPGWVPWSVCIPNLAVFYPVTETLPELPRTPAVERRSEGVSTGGGLTWHKDVEPFLLVSLRLMRVIIGTQVFPCVYPGDIGQCQDAGEIAIRGHGHLLWGPLGHSFPHHRIWTRAGQNQGTRDVEDEFWPRRCDDQA